MKYDYIVDAKGGGDFRTIQEAVDANNENRPCTYYWSVKESTVDWRLTYWLSDLWFALTLSLWRRKWQHRLFGHRRDGQMLHQHSWGWHGSRSL